MQKDQKSNEQLQAEQQRRKMEEQKTEHVFEDKDRIPNEQNAFKETQYQRGE